MKTTGEEQFFSGTITSQLRRELFNNPNSLKSKDINPSLKVNISPANKKFADSSLKYSGPKFESPMPIIQSKVSLMESSRYDFK